MRAVVYRGFSRNTEVEVDLDLTHVAVGAAQIDCIECGGDGDWSKFHPEPHTLIGDERNCVECKGTGRIYVSA